MWTCKPALVVYCSIQLKLSKNTVKPVLSRHPIKQTPSFKRTVAEVPKSIFLIYFKWNLYHADTSIKWTRTLREYLKWSFLLLSTCIKRTLVILNSTTQHARHRKCKWLPHTNVNIFTLKNVTWRTYLISFTVQCCFLFRFVSIELVSLIWVLQIWVAIYVYGTIIN